LWQDRSGTCRGTDVDCEEETEGCTDTEDESGQDADCDDAKLSFDDS